MWKIFILAFLLIPTQIHSESEGFMYKKGKFYYFKGKGRPKLDSTNKTQRLSLSKEAAIMDGKAKIAFYIDGLKTKSGISVAKIKGKDEKVKTRVRMILDGVETVKTDWDDQDNCTAILKINYKSIMKLQALKMPPDSSGHVAR